MYVGRTTGLIWFDENVAVHLGLKCLNALVKLHLCKKELIWVLDSCKLLFGFNKKYKRWKRKSFKWYWSKRQIGPFSIHPSIYMQVERDFFLYTHSEAILLQEAYMCLSVLQESCCRSMLGFVPGFRFQSGGSRRDL